MKYFDELCRAMELVASDRRTIFLGQAVTFAGTGMTNTLKNVPQEKLFEFPVTEELQMGVSTGLALTGAIPVSIFPRWNFLLLATSQLVSHLDKLSDMSSRGYQPKVIIRTSVGSERPLHPQHQHVGDYTDAFRLMCKNIEVVRLEEPADIVPSYDNALNRQDGRSTILVEYGDFYSEK